MSCEIIIENSVGYFVPGGCIEGRAKYHIHKQKNIRSIILRIRGKEHTEWMEGSGKNRKNYSGNNIFFQSEVKLHDEGDIGPGDYEYPFKFVLPADCPSTFVEEKNWIRYSLKLTVDIPFAPDDESKVTFTVINPVDLNTQRFVNAGPAQFHNDKRLCCWCCTSGPISLDLYIYKQAYTVGEIIKLKVHCSNLSNQSVEAVTASINKVLKLTANRALQSGHSKNFETIITSQSYTGVGAHGERDYDMELTVPQHLVIPNFTQCMLLEMWFTLKIVAVLPTCSKNLEVGCAVTLGHIPLRGPLGTQVVKTGAVTFPNLHPGTSGSMQYPGDTSNFAFYPSASAPPNEDDILLNKTH